MTRRLTRRSGKAFCNKPRLSSAESQRQLYAKDATRKSGNIFYDDGSIDPHYVQLYFDKYVKLDPATTGHFFAEIDQPMATEDLLPYEEFLETRFYKEWAKPQRLVDHLTVVLDKSTTSVALFGVFRHERHGLADDPMRRRMRLIAPHIRRAVLIGRAIDLKTAEAATLADTFDGLRAGMFLVDAAAASSMLTLPGMPFLRRRLSARAGDG